MTIMKQILKNKLTISIVVIVIMATSFLVWKLFIYNPPTRPLTPIETQTVKADMLFQEGRTKEAKKAYDEVINLAASDEHKADALEQKAIACSTYADRKCADEAVNRYKQYSTSDYEVALLNATILDKAGKQKQAHSEYQKVLNILSDKQDLTSEEKLVKENAESKVK